MEHHIVGQTIAEYSRRIRCPRCQHLLDGLNHAIRDLQVVQDDQEAARFLNDTAPVDFDFKLNQAVENVSRARCVYLEHLGSLHCMRAGDDGEHSVITDDLQSW